MLHHAITEIADQRSTERAVTYADVLIGAVLVRGEKTPHVVTREMVARMKPGSVIVDVSIDQGGCVETSRPTRLDDPIFIESSVIHYAVPNMASAVTRTASLAMTHAALPYLRALADEGVEPALKADPGLAAGVYTYRGRLVHEALARTFNMACQRFDALAETPAPPGSFRA
jgi:alanine dehydrogenase